MDDPLERFSKDYHGQTFLDPLGLAAVLLCGIALLLLPRRYSIWPILVMACFVAPSQRIAIFTLNFDLLRVMVLFGTFRVLVRTEWKGFLWRPVDRLVVVWAIVGTLAFTALHGSAEALKFKLGTSYDAIGMYFLFRFLVRTWQDVQCIVLGLTVLTISASVFFFVEWMTGRNIFSVFGGVRQITLVREGRLRCQGAFPHAILAGCFFATTLPLILAQWWQRRRIGALAILGVAAGLFIVVASASATPLLAVFCATAGGVAYFVRHRMRLLRWGILLLLIGLHLTMNAPVWHLISRVSAVGGATGWHRYYLIDQAVNRVGEWWLLGTTSTRHWGRGLQDVTNQYILEGVRGGIVTLALFIAILVISFRRVGLLWRCAAGDREQRIMAWALGVSLFVHVTSFVGVSYFGQINMLWYLSLAMITSMTNTAATIPKRNNVSRPAVALRVAAPTPNGSACPI